MQMVTNQEGAQLSIQCNGNSMNHKIMVIEGMLDDVKTAAENLDEIEGLTQGQRFAVVRIQEAMMELQGVLDEMEDDFGHLAESDLEFMRKSE